METKLPILSYVVKTQFVTNSVGLKTLHQQIFTDENILLAREKAMDYYNAAIEVLESEGEIYTDHLSGKIVYRNPEKFENGLSVYMRTNHDIQKFGIADLKDAMFLIDAHFAMNSRENRFLYFSRNYEQKYFKVLKLDKKTNEIPFIARRFAKVAELQQLKKKTIEECEFIEFNDRENDMELLLQTACAFMNTQGGTIILGQNEAMNNKTDKNNILEMEYIIKRLLENSFNKQNFQVLKKDLNQVRFLEIVVPKSTLETFYQTDYYFRNQFGNVVDLDKSFL